MKRYRQVCAHEIGLVVNIEPISGRRRWGPISPPPPVEAIPEPQYLGPQASAAGRDGEIFAVTPAVNTKKGTRPRRPADQIGSAPIVYTRGVASDPAAEAGRCAPTMSDSQARPIPKTGWEIVPSENKATCAGI